jgi:hypothetical protein
VHFPVLFKAEQPLPHSQETQETRIVAALQQALEQVAYQQSHLRLLLVATAESLDSMSGRVRSACFHTEIENKVCACDALCEFSEQATRVRDSTDSAATASHPTKTNALQFLSHCVPISKCHLTCHCKTLQLALHRLYVMPSRRSRYGTDVACYARRYLAISIRWLDVAVLQHWSAFVVQPMIVYAWH